MKRRTMPISNKGMAKYNAGIRPRPILFVYVIPTALAILALIVTNWN